MVDLFFGVNAAFQFMLSYYLNVPFLLPIKVASVYSTALDKALRINLISHFKEKDMLTFIPLDFLDSLNCLPGRVIEDRIILSLSIYKLSICLVVNIAIRDPALLVYHRYFKISYKNVKT